MISLIATWNKRKGWWDTTDMASVGFTMKLPETIRGRRVRFTSLSSPPKKM